MIYFVADGRSDCGRVRGHNEDTLLVDSKRGLFAVADGMGGHAGGEIASGLAVTTMFRTLSDNKRSKAEPCSREMLQTAVEQANNAVYQDARLHPERKEMGTTLTVLCWGLRQFYLAHVGDSRAYRLRGNELTQLTTDHTWVDMQVRAGLLTREEAEHARMRHILVKSLGTQPGVESDIMPVDVEPKDRFLLCSDGLSDLVKHDDLKDILVGRGRVSSITRRLIKRANFLGGRDNITAVVIDCYDKKWHASFNSVFNKVGR